MTDEDMLAYPHAVFAVDDRPLCVWDAELEDHNVNFCSNVNPDWFIDSIAPHIEAHDLETIKDLDQEAALTLRLAYHHALETFFALLFAAVQAPFCVPAWLDTYEIKDLASLIHRVNYRDRILNGWGVPRLSWQDLSGLFNSAWVNKDNGTATVEKVAQAWSRLAGELVDETNRAEYNSIKHGFRARPGGFVLRMGLEETPGTPAPADAMRTIGASKHGSSVFSLTPIPKDAKRRKAVHFHMRRQSTNWNPLSTFGKLQILVISMGNVLNTVRTRNGVPAETVLFHRLQNPEDYLAPWRRSVGVHSSGFYIEGPRDGVVAFSTEVLRQRLEEASGFNLDEDVG